MMQFIICIEPAWDAEPYNAFLCNTKAVLNFAEDMFSNQQGTDANTVVTRPKKDADGTFSALFQAAASPSNNLD